MGDPVIEVGIVVSDGDRMISFYRDALGLAPQEDWEVPGGVMKRFAHGNEIVKLVVFDTPPAVKNPPMGIMGGSGIRYVTLYVDNVDAAVARCEAAQTPVPVPAFDYKPGMRVAIIEDPDGNWIELAGKPR